MPQDPYKTLGVPQNASQEQIRSAYRKEALNAHPDKGGDTQKWTEIRDGKRNQKLNRT